MFIQCLSHFTEDFKGWPGRVVDVTDHKGAALIRAGLATNVQEGTRRQPGPTLSPRTDIRTGGEKQSSSSQADQVLKTSTPIQPVAEQNSLQSTTAINSSRSRKSSTPAMAPGGSQKTDLLNSRG